MVTSNIIQRTFYIKYQNYLGTGFTFERNGTQYLASVKHIFSLAESGQHIEFSLMRNNEWITVNSIIQKHKTKSVDIAILSLPEDISPRHPIELSIEGMTMSQDAFFLGFPLGHFMEDTNYLNNGYPIPFVKQGIVSTIPITKDGLQLFYLDALNNPGFSGGPCVAFPNNNQLPRIYGITKGYLPDPIDVNTPFGNYGFESNSGLVEIHSINHLKEIVF